MAPGKWGPSNGQSIISVSPPSGREMVHAFTAQNELARIQLSEHNWSSLVSKNNSAILGPRHCSCVPRNPHWRHERGGP